MYNYKKNPNNLINMELYTPNPIPFSFCISNFLNLFFFNIIESSFCYQTVFEKLH